MNEQGRKERERAKIGNRDEILSVAKTLRASVNPAWKERVAHCNLRSVTSHGWSQPTAPSHKFSGFTVNHRTSGQ